MSRIDPEYQEYLDTLIYKKTLREFFNELREQAHHIYALLAKMPTSVFRIVYDDDDENRHDLSYQEFYTRLGEFHRRKLSFHVYFNAYFFRDEWDTCCELWELAEYEFAGKEKYEISHKDELSVAVFEKEFPHLLAFYCRECILANKPFQLTRQTIKEFGFTRKDVPIMRDLVSHCNERIIEELRAKYDELAAIDCLHEPAPQRRKTATKKSS